MDALEKKQETLSVTNTESTPTIGSIAPKIARTLVGGQQVATKHAIYTLLNRLYERNMVEKVEISMPSSELENSVGINKATPTYVIYKTTKKAKSIIANLTPINDL
jgi:hypothetical protein